MLIAEISQPSDLSPTEDPLTDREVEVLKLLAQGMSNEEISESLVISDRTVGKHVSNLLDKLPRKRCGLLGAAQVAKSPSKGSQGPGKCNRT